MPSIDEDGLPIEEFIQALTGQLDRAQVTMSFKARVGLPLTFAVKEISIDLRAHVNMVRNRVLIRPAGPGEQDTSVIHLALTTITRPMMEENTLRFEPDEPSLNEVLGDSLEDDDKRRLEWAGIHNVSQLRELERSGGTTAIEQVSQIPAVRLRQALERASKPHISRVFQDDSGLLRVRGLNLAPNEETPTVLIDNEPVSVVQASDRELLLSLPAQLSSSTFSTAFGVQPLTLTVETSDGNAAETTFGGDGMNFGGNGIYPLNADESLPLSQPFTASTAPQLTSRRLFRNGGKTN